MLFRNILILCSIHNLMITINLFKMKNKILLIVLLSFTYVTLKVNFMLVYIILKLSLNMQMNLLKMKKIIIPKFIKQELILEIK